ncbi:MAG: AraC family transcriptional regulator [Oscillospiraceae bacterium]
MELSTINFNPQLLRASTFSSYGDNMRDIRLVPRRCCDYELEYYTACNGGIIVDGDYLEFQSGEINLRRPGQVVCGVLPYSCYIFCFSVDSSPKSKEGYLFGTPEEAEPNYRNPLLDLLPAKIIPKNLGAVKGLVRELFQVASRPDDLSVFHSQKLLRDLLYQLFCEQWERDKIIYNRKVIFAAEYIKEHFCEEISVGKLIENSGLSKAYFHKCFKSYTRFSPTALMISLRMERAKTLLHISEDSIADIALACGYYDPVYFTHLFHKITGVTPSAYRPQGGDLRAFSAGI